MKMTAASSATIEAASASGSDCPWTPAQMTDVFGTRYYYDAAFDEPM